MSAPVTHPATGMPGWNYLPGNQTEGSILKKDISEN
jgi:hypothetical protein